MAMGLGAFTEGLQGGIASRDKMDMNRQYKKLLKMKAHETEMGISGKNDQLESLGMDRMDYMPDEDPALIRFGGWLKQKMGFGGGEAAPSAGGIQDATPDQPQMSPVAQPPQQLWQGKADGGRIRRMADGGRAYTDEERMKRSYGDSYVTEEEAAETRAYRDSLPPRYQSPYSPYMSGRRDKLAAGRRSVPVDGGGPREFYGDLVRNAGDVLENTFQGISNYGMAAEQAIDDIADSKDATDAGGAVRRSIGDAYGATMNVAGGVATDLGIPSAIDFVGGLVGFDGKAGDQAATPPPSAPAGAGAATEATTPAPEQSDEKIAQQAIDTGEKAAAENFDYRYLPEDTRPEDMPSMTTEDWTVNRRMMMQGLIKDGKDPDEALKIVDDITVGQQMRGMERELGKAMNYLAMGDYRATMFAVRQGFQYFPNGVDVKFAVQTNPKTGQQALVSFGVDEKTGEPTGTPQIITPDRLSAMAQAFSDPDKFRQWTKDGHDLQLEIAKFKDLSKYRQESLDIAEANAITARRRADAAGEGGGIPGMKYGDVDRRSGDMRDLLSEAEFSERIPEGLAPKLGAYAEEVMRYIPGAGASTISEMLLSAWNAEGDFEGMPGGEETVKALLDSIRKRAAGE